jgi:hypothetical protein
VVKIRLDGILVTSVMDIAEVKEVLLSISRATQKGFVFKCWDQEATLGNGVKHIRFRHERGLYRARTRIEDTRLQDNNEDTATKVIMPVEGGLMEEECGDDGAKEEQEPAVGVAVPIPPSAAVQEAHRLTLVPYYPWCSTCVVATAWDDSHYARGSVPLCTEVLDEREVIKMDYAIMGEETVVAIYSTLHHAGHATVVDRKGPTAWATSWVFKKLAINPSYTLKTLSTT